MNSNHHNYITICSISFSQTGAIRPREADLIFLTEWNSPNGKYKNNDEPPAATPNSNAEFLNSAWVPLTRAKSTETKNDLETNKNATNSAPVAAANPLGRDIAKAIFIQSSSPSSDSLPTVGIPSDHNTTTPYNRANWQDPYLCNVPKLASAAPWRRPDMEGFKRNDGCNYNNRPRDRYNRVRSRVEHPTRPDPNFIDAAWIQAAHKYTIAFESVCHCLELCGLRKETVSV